MLELVCLYYISGPMLDNFVISEEKKVDGPPDLNFPLPGEKGPACLVKVVIFKQNSFTGCQLKPFKPFKPFF